MVLFTIMGKLLTTLTVDYPIYKMGNSMKYVIELWVILSHNAH